MNGKTFFLVGMILFCIALSFFFIGATLGMKIQRDIDNRKIEAMTEQNLQCWTALRT